MTLTSPACRRAFDYYVGLARRYSVKGPQDVDTTRDAYFAGRAAMILWSPFLLDAMAGLRNDAVPSCPECKKDPAYLARHSGLVGPLERADGSPAQYGNVSTWGIFDGAGLDGAKGFVRYMMSDGYVRWLALSPQGKYPVRFGDRADPERFVTEWSRLQSGVERKAPLRRFYSEASVQSLGAGVQSFQRWGFEQDRAALDRRVGGPAADPEGAVGGDRRAHRPRPSGRAGAGRRREGQGLPRVAAVVKRVSECGESGPRRHVSRSCGTRAPSGSRRRTREGRSRHPRSLRRR